MQIKHAKIEVKMDISELKEMKTKLGLSNKKVAELSGVPLGTVQKVFSGETKRPRRDTLMAIYTILIAEYQHYDCGNTYRFPERDSRPSIVREETESFYDNMSVHNTSLAGNSDFFAGRLWDRQGQYTLDDYFALPDDLRVELIDGVFYYMEAPGAAHQAIIVMLSYLFMEYKNKTGHSFLPFVAPFDVQLDMDNRTMVEPDVLVVCDRDKLKGGKRLYGAPDLVIEVLSDSTRAKDLLIKVNKYRNAGVKECWVVDPKRKTVIVYDFANDDYPINYTFEDTVEVRLTGGELAIDFTRIKAMLDDIGV